MITISTQLLIEARHRIENGDIEGCDFCTYRDICSGVYSVGGEPQFPICAESDLEEYFDEERYEEIIREEWEEMTPLEKMCKELGIEIDEVWTGNDGNDYQIKPDGHLIKIHIPTGVYSTVADIIWINDDIRKVLTGDLQPRWEPKHGETYYVPNIDTASCTAETWTDTSLDLMRQRKGIVFKTIAEATTCATRMLEIV